MRRAWLPLLAIAACTRYEPRPLSPETGAAEWSMRSLSDTAVLRVAGHTTGDSTWPVHELVLAAWYLKPELERARSAWRTAQAAEITAGARPQPGISLIGERSDAGPFEAPWAVALSLTIPVELGGKRGARIAAARARTLQAELDARTVAWNLASDVRTAALGSMQLDSAVASWGRRMTIGNRIAEQAALLYESGSIRKGSVEQAAVTVQLIDREHATAVARAVAARGDLARLLGVPVPALDGIALSPDGQRGCDWTAELHREEMRATALRRRYEMGAALAAYAVREGELRVAVAGQYPDLEIGPGFAWDQGLKRWVLGLALPELLLNRNRGPIAEATARRAEAGTVVDVVQQQVLSEVDAAIADCEASARALESAKAMVNALTVREHSIRAAFDRGEVTQSEGLSLALAAADAEDELQRISLERAVLGSRLARVAGLWSSTTADSLPDPLAWPTVRAPVARSTN